ncbi:uncharacterized protein J3R85_019341 [Psidium guajava]|nr:uncharacterized protein J3R85_019341 [Psidium guajava]
MTGTLSLDARQTGDILVNGHKQSGLWNLAYVMQDNVLLAVLTVREVVYYTIELQLPDSMPISKKRESAEMAIREI